VDQSVRHQFVDDREHATGPVELLAEVRAGRPQVHDERDGQPSFLPDGHVQRNADVLGDRVEMDGRVGGAADGGLDLGFFSWGSR
jgi:hypothetical protein